MLQLKRTLAFMTDCLDEDLNQLGEEVSSCSIDDPLLMSTATDTAESAMIRKPKKPKPK